MKKLSLFLAFAVMHITLLNSSGLFNELVVRFFDNGSIRDIKILVRPTTTIIQIKELLESKVKKSPDQQTLSFCGTEIVSGTAQDAHLSSGSSVDLYTGGSAELNKH